MRTPVAVIKCDDYREEQVDSAVRRGVKLLGGIETFCKEGERVVLKPNLLIGDKPGKCVTTHPSVFQAVAKLFQEAGADLFYGDSPGAGKPERAAKGAGIKDVADKLGIPPADFSTTVKITYPQALIAKQLPLAAGVLDSALISISKMKTHGFTRITGAVKNQFGCIPGLRKGEFHVKMPDTYQFSSVLVDINRFLSPRLCIMDGIIAMEGNGPRGGTPKAMNVLLFSGDPVALDSVFCKLINMKPDYVPFLKIGKEAGLGTYLENEIELIGDPIEDLIDLDFEAVRRPPDRMASSKSFPVFLKNLISPKPLIDYNRCTNCGTCVKQCPVNPRAVDWPDHKAKEKPLFNYKRCIRCYCCQEMCPERAISIKTPFLGKLIHR